ncbi:MAG: ABC transporter permease subunit [Streptosporangiales bacterium]|nr:ABC transporter permease subunit [Streptosporangiales bacterium]
MSRTAGVNVTLRRPPLRVALPGAVVALYVLAATLGPLLVPYDASQTNVAERLLPPGTTLVGGSTAWFGTDQVGRDLLAQVLAGARVSLVVAAATIVLGGALGLVLGLLAGYFGRWIDSVVMRLGDIQLAFPSILLAILIAGVLGPSVGNVILTLAVTRWVVFARVVRASVLVARRRESVDGAKVLGVPTVRILWRYILPDVLGSLLVVATVQVGLMIIAEASLSFLGLGVPTSQASWGSTIAAGRDYLDSAWWIAAVPGLAMAVLVVCVGVLGDALRHRTDPTVDL